MTTRRTPAYSEKLDAALRLAAAAHYEDMRKGSQIPYVMHPFHVGLILDRYGFDEDLVIAGILHDVLEDPEFEARSIQDRLRAVCPELTSAAGGGAFRDAVVDYIRQRFGETVLALVEHVTEQKTDGNGEDRPWKVRKDEQLAALDGVSRDVAALKAADCLHNLHAMTRDVRENGTDSLFRFKGGPDGAWWYYSNVVRLVSPVLGNGHPLVTELEEALSEFTGTLTSAGVL